MINIQRLQTHWRQKQH